MKRTPIIAGNWKMNSPSKLAETVVEKGQNNVENSNREVILFPPFTALSHIKNIIEGSVIQLGAQNLYHERSGAYTGEISGEMLKDVGCTHVIIGHSERRTYFSETNSSVNQKIKAAYSTQLMPILCVGETLKEREEDLTMDIIKTQLQEGITGITWESQTKIIIAYEPIWAIGTGKVASPEQAQEVHQFIRSQLDAIIGHDYANKTSILYGGSVKPENAAQLIAQEDIDGFLVGGASLNADDFLSIIEAT